MDIGIQVPLNLDNC